MAELVGITGAASAILGTMIAATKKIRDLRSRYQGVPLEVQMLSDQMEILAPTMEFCTGCLWVLIYHYARCCDRFQEYIYALGSPQRISRPSYHRWKRYLAWEGQISLFEN